MDHQAVAGVSDPGRCALVRDPWPVGRWPLRLLPGPLPVAAAAWTVGRGPVAVLPGARAARPGACYLVRDPWPVDLVPVAVPAAPWCLDPCPG